MNVVKYEIVPRKRWEVCQNRLRSVGELAFFNLNSGILPFTWGLLPAPSEHQIVIRIQSPLVAGSTLREAANRLSTKDKSILQSNLLKLQMQYARIGFVHGDLSPSNLLIIDQQLTLCGIDWLLDLNSKTGTPRYSSPAIINGIHTLETDHYSFSKIHRFLYCPQT